MNDFVGKLAMFAVAALLAILVVQHLVLGRPQARLEEAARYKASLFRSIQGDPRFENIQDMGTSWSGPGHPVYIALGGSVRSVEDWIAFSNRVVLARPPVEVPVGTIRISP